MFHRTRLFSVIHNTITDLILWTLDLMNFENEFNSYNNVKFKVNKSTFTFILFMLHVILTNGIRSNLKEIDIMTDDLFPTNRIIYSVEEGVISTLIYYLLYVVYSVDIELHVL